MGFKNIEEHYEIKHTVQVCNKPKYGGDCICIGSSLWYDIIVINIAKAKVVVPYKKSEYLANKDLVRYSEQLIEGEQIGVLAKLINDPDVFAKSIPTYTTSDWAVVADLCEESGYPNVTHSGKLMYDNTYFKTREEAYAYLLTTTKIKHRDYKHNFQEAIARIKLAFRHLFHDYKCWVLARTIGRINHQ